MSWIGSKQLNKNEKSVKSDWDDSREKQRPKVCFERAVTKKERENECERGRA